MTFTASNGVHITKKGSSSLAVERPMTDRLLSINAERVSALREFFQHERDEELGRWRWPENPDWVAIEGERSTGRRTVVLVDERTLERHWLNDLVMDSDGYRETKHEAARAYFEANPEPEPEPKPWHDAKNGEAWVITWKGGEFAVVCDGAYFNWPFGSTQAVIDPDITAGRRLWPEDAS